MPLLTNDVKALAALWVSSGTLHLAKPQVFEAIVPRSLPAHRALVYASGVAEIACAAALLHPRTRRLGGWASAVLLVAVYPANIQMALDSGRSRRLRPKVIAYGRLPFQLPMIWTALKATRRP